MELSSCHKQDLMALFDRIPYATMRFLVALFDRTLIMSQ
jgi:hypothetical protein